MNVGSTFTTRLQVWLQPCHLKPSDLLHPSTYYIYPSSRHNTCSLSWSRWNQLLQIICRHCIHRSDQELKTDIEFYFPICLLVVTLNTTRSKLTTKATPCEQLWKTRLAYIKNKSSKTSRCQWERHQPLK